MSIADYFDGGIAGFWHNPETGVFTDTAGTTAANPADSVARINDTGPNGSNSLQSTSGNRPLLSDDGALIFDGSNDCLISSVASNAINMPFVIAARFTPNAVAATNSGAYRVITRGNSNNTRGAISVDNGFVRILTSASVGLNTKAIEIGETVNVIALFESTGTTAWVNGTKYTTTDFITALASTVPIRIGAQTNNTATTVDRRFDGKLYQHGVLNRGINDDEAAEIDEILTGAPPAPPMEVPPVGILWQTTFEDITAGAYADTTIDIDGIDFYFWRDGDSTLDIIADGTAPSGKALRMGYTAGAERVSGIVSQSGTPAPGAGKKMHVVLDLEYAGYSALDGIKKTIRFKSGGTIVCTVNAQYDVWRIDFEDSGGGFYDQTELSAATYGPNTFIGTRRTLEVMVDFTSEAAPLYAAWVDGVEILSGTGSAVSAFPEGGNVDGAVISTIFNGPAATGTDTIRQIIFADSFIGVEEPEPEPEDSGITLRGITASQITVRGITARSL